ncbi:MAG: DUF370 domain-containing protein [Clostridia bacterium]|nr:DUF370 domain-containing protein [Clostridia bacterium]
MFLHLGADTVIQTDHILGIFDLDTTTVQKSSREYLNLAEKAGRVVNVSPFELPKSFVVCEEGNTLASAARKAGAKKAKEELEGEKQIVVYLSQLSASTLLGRLQSKSSSFEI